MNDVIAVMLDVSGLVTRGSDVARTEARCIAAERERRAAANAQNPADQPSAALAHATERSPVRPRRGLLAAWAHGLSA